MNKIFNLVQNASTEDKARLMALRSSNATVWMQHPYGRHNARDYTLTNDEFSMLTRLQYGVPIIPSHANSIKCVDIDIDNPSICRLCGERHDEHGQHAWKCKKGRFGQIYHYDLMNKWPLVSTMHLYFG
jgi:hypothetical protein